jgi:hypothetical protein
LTYSSAQEAVNVQSNLIDIFETTPVATDSLLELYDKSIFADLDDYNQNPLSDDQKRAIIADQIAVLFISQHPVVSSDLSPAKIQGFGGEKAIQTQKMVEKVITYAERYDSEIIQMAQNRLFGMLANYRSFSFADELNELFDTNDQSLQTIVEPPRIIYLDEFGNLSDDIGVEGILFTPYSIENLHTEVLSDVPPADPYSIPLYKYSVGIDTLIVTDDDDNNLDCGDTDIKLSFNIVFGEEKINEIYYQVWINNNSSYNEHIDKTGATRDYTFDFSTIGGISCSVSVGDILTARVTVLDIYGFSNVFERKLFYPFDQESPAITEITSFQREDGSGLIDVYYYYQGVSEINPANVSLTYSTDNTSFSSVTTNVIGDIGLGIMPGYRKITWNPTGTLTDANDIAFMKITLTDVDESTNIGITESSVVIVDLSIPEVAIRKLSIKEEERMAESSSLSDSSDSSDSSFSSESSSSSEGHSSESSSSQSNSSSSSERYSESSSSSSGKYSESSSSSSLGYSESSSSSSLGYSESSSSSENYSESSSSSENYSESSSSSSEKYSESSSSSENYSESSSSENYSESSSSENYSESSSSEGYSESSSSENYSESSSSSENYSESSSSFGYSESSSSSENYSESSSSGELPISAALPGVTAGSRMVVGALNFSGGVPIVAYLAFAPVRSAWASDSVGETWGTLDFEDIDIVGSLREPSLAIVSGLPAVAYANGSSDSIKYARAISANGSSWNPEVVVDSSSGPLLSPSLKIISGRPAISYFDGGAGGKLSYLRSDDSTGSAWTGTAIIIPDTSADFGVGSSLLEVNGRPAIFYYDRDNNQVSYLRSDDSTGASWTVGNIQVIDSVTGAGGVSPILDMKIVSGRPAVVYSDNIAVESYYLRADDADGSAWTGTPQPIESTFGGNPKLSLAIVNNRPAVTIGNKYLRSDDINGASWTLGNTVTISDISIIYDLSVIKGKPAVAGTGTFEYRRSADLNGDVW